jgi:hypothetical protein
MLLLSHVRPPHSKVLLRQHIRPATIVGGWAGVEGHALLSHVRPPHSDVLLRQIALHVLINLVTILKCEWESNIVQAVSHRLLTAESLVSR